MAATSSPEGSGRRLGPAEDNFPPKPVGRLAQAKGSIRP